MKKPLPPTKLKGSGFLLFTPQYSLTHYITSLVTTLSSFSSYNFSSLSTSATCSISHSIAYISSSTCINSFSISSRFLAFLFYWNHFNTLSPLAFCFITCFSSFSSHFDEPMHSFLQTQIIYIHQSSTSFQITYLKITIM